jgi:hypothetical protein
VLEKKPVHICFMTTLLWVALLGIVNGEKYSDLYYTVVCYDTFSQPFLFIYFFKAMATKRALISCQHQA